LRLAMLFLLFASPLLGGPRVIKGQKVPDQKRTLEIQHALVEKGYLSQAQVTGHWDAETRDACSQIAREHHWQSRHVPDARTLIFLGLSKGNPEVLLQPNHLDYNKGAPDVVPEDEQ